MTQTHDMTGLNVPHNSLHSLGFQCEIHDFLQIAKINCDYVLPPQAATVIMGRETNEKG